MTLLSLIEPVPIDDDLCNGIGAIEDLGFGVRLVFYADQRSFEAGGQILHVIKRKIVMPTDGFTASHARVRAFLARRTPPRNSLRLVR